ncbi:hypothetical protein diail_12295 [Diaporthe ilicicola]|nr:hypothetical protein diail_12295 [Diaporthe ilicicola]
MMKLTNILSPSRLIAVGAVGAVAGYQQDNSGQKHNSINAINTTAAGQGNVLATLSNGYVTWTREDDDQESCGNAEAKAVGNLVILKSDCQQVIDYMSSRSGYWKIEGYVSGGAYAQLVNRGTCSFEVARVDEQSLYFEIGNLDAIDFVRQAMGTSTNVDHLSTVIGNVHCNGENSPLVEWKG